jgi:putative transposase
MSDAASPPDLADISREDWELARRRFEVIQSLNQLTDRTRAHAKHAAAVLGCSLTLVYRLLGRHAADPRLTSCLPARRGRRQGLLRLPASTEEIIQAAIEELYLTPQRPRVSVLVKEILRRCRTLALPPPSRTAIELRVRRRPAAETTARREGRKAARDRFGRATGSLHAPWPLSLIQIDHTLVDVIVVDSLTRAPIQRPWLTLAIDVCSRCVVGFHLSLEAPSATSVALCLTQAALPKNGWLSARQLQGEWPVSGIPERLHLDNAKELHSEALRRGCEQYGIAVDYRPVRTPHYGGHIERLIGTMMGKVHLLPGTTFSSVADKGDFDPQQSAAMTLEEVERWLTTAIVGVYHQEIHRSLGTTPSRPGGGAFSAMSTVPDAASR